MFRTLCLLVTSSFLSRVSCGPRLRLASRCGESKTLWDLMSRCAMPRAWRKAKAVAEGSRMFRCLGENTGGRWLVFWAAMLQQPVDSTPHADQLNSPTPHVDCSLLLQLLYFGIGSNHMKRIICLLRAIPWARLQTAPLKAVYHLPRTAIVLSGPIIQFSLKIAGRHRTYPSTGPVPLRVTLKTSKPHFATSNKDATRGSWPYY